MDELPIMLAVLATLILLAFLTWSIKSTRSLIEKYSDHIEKTMETEEVKRFLEEEPRASVAVIESPDKKRVKVIWVDRKGRIGVSALVDVESREILSIRTGE
ncbi:MAG: hypothetical protein LRS47_00625 [Desulfurococcales archaeon]|nr:hypothetical protein [Desulfurococcales archaeon]